MIKISREEADMLREKAPSVHIAVVNRQHKSRCKTYYAEENNTSMALLRIARGLPEPPAKRDRSQQWRRPQKRW